MDSLERRARVHAALGEPARLAIVDRLVPGDLSPGELAETFGLATNLLAHHLKVLQAAGLIRRVRSEGDRRRSYVQLCLEDPLVRSAVAPIGSAVESAIRGAPRVVFVCTHNSARSQLAAASWERISRIPVASAGTHPAARVHPRAVAAGRRHGLQVPKTGTTQVQQVLRDGDLIVAVCDNAHEELDPDATRLHWAIPDPVRIDTDRAFDDAYEEIARRVELLADATTRAWSPER